MVTGAARSEDDCLYDALASDFAERPARPEARHVAPCGPVVTRRSPSGGSHKVDRPLDDQRDGAGRPCSKSANWSAAWRPPRAHPRTNPCALGRSVRGLAANSPKVQSCIECIRRQAASSSMISSRSDQVRTFTEYSRRACKIFRLHFAP